MTKPGVNAFVGSGPLTAFQTYSAIRAIGATEEISTLLLDGPPGVGKTFLARAIARHLGARVLRFQFYPGCGKSELLFDPLLRTAENANGGGVLTQAVLASAAGEMTVLILDEIDKAEPVVDGFLLNFLSEGRLDVPQLGELRADSGRLLVAITKNDARAVGNPLLRRCRVVHLGWPSVGAELALFQEYLPVMPSRAVELFLEEPRRLRTNPVVIKPPSTPELIRLAGDLLDFVQWDPEPAELGQIYRGAIAVHPEDQRHIDRSDTFFGTRLIEIFQPLAGSCPARAGDAAATGFLQSGW